MAGSFPEPGLRAATIPPAYSETHWSHAGHQEPEMGAAFSNHSSGVLGSSSFLPITVLAPRGVDDASDVPRRGENELHGGRIDSCCRVGRSPWRDMVLAGRQQERR